MVPLALFLHDFQLVRRAAAMVVANRNDLRTWHARTATAARVTSWMSADLCQAAAVAKETAAQLREASSRLRDEALRLRAARSQRGV